MRALTWFLSSTILVLTACAICPPLEAAENSQPLEAAAKIESFLDERLAVSFYLDSKFPDKTAAESGKLRENIEAFKGEILRDPDLTREGRLNISRQLIPAFMNLDKHKEALELCEDFADRYPESKDDIVKLYYLTGFSCQELSRYDQAIESYQQALLYSGKGGFANHIRVNLGWCYYKKDEYDKAINEYNRALQEGLLDQGIIQWVWFETGRCRFFLKKYEDAIEAFRQTLNVNRDTKLARQARANIKDIERLRKGGAS